jgi:hypothetical protein
MENRGTLQMKIMTLENCELYKDDNVVHFDGNDEIKQPDV